MSWRYFPKCRNVAMTKDKACQILLSPWITEKSSAMAVHNQSVFLVPLKATKPQIKAAVEQLFTVDVIAVSTLVSKPKRKRFRGRIGTRTATKKAIVRLKDGQKLDYAQTIS